MNLLLLAIMLPSCTNVLTVDASESLEAELTPYIDTLTSTACEGAWVSMEPREEGYLISITRDKEQAETIAANKDDAFALVAAFLAMPRLDSKPIIAATVPEAPSTSPSGEATSKSLPLLSISAMAGANAAIAPPIFGGADFELASVLAPNVFIALRGGAMATPRDLYLPLRVAAGARFFEGALLAGLGGGALFSLNRRQNAAPMIELMVRGVTPLFKNVFGFAELSGAYAFTDLQNRIPELNAGLRLGVTWEVFQR